MRSTLAGHGDQDQGSDEAIANDVQPLSGLTLACFPSPHPASCTVGIPAYDRAIREHYARAGAASPEPRRRRSSAWPCPYPMTPRFSTSLSERLCSSAKGNVCSSLAH